MFSNFLNGSKLLADAALTNPVIGTLGNAGTNPAGATAAAIFLTYAIRMWRIAISLGALIVLGYFVMAGVEWISSGNDTKGVEKAKQRMTHATIGLILLVSSFVLVAFVGGLLFGADFDILRITLPASAPIPSPT
jgi:hypothetical protein